MKFLTLLLSFFMLYMSCLPCGDGMECNEPDAQATALADHKEHKHTSEACSPFCACACCSASTFFIPVLKIQIEKAAVSLQKFYPFDSSFTMQGFSSIWQPPQLS